MSYAFILLTSCCIVYICSVYNMCEQYLKCPKINKWIFIIIVISLTAIINYVNTLISIPYILNAFLLNFFILTLFMFAFKDNTEKKLFTALIVITTRTLVWNFFCSLLSCAVLTVINIATGGQVKVINESLDIVISSASYLLVAWAIYTLKQALDYVYDSGMNSWYYALSTPLLVITTIVEIINWGASIGISVVSNVNGAAYWNIYKNQIFSHTAICILTALSAFASCSLVFGISKIYMEQKQKELYYYHVKFYKMLDDQYLQMERLRHDMKNHILSLYQLWKNNESDKLGKYLASMVSTGNIGKAEDVTGNRIIDALLYYKQKQVEKHDIIFQCDITSLKNCKIDEFDLCVIFGNILDNALSACLQSPQKRFINVNAQKIKGCFLLIVKNSTALTNIKDIEPDIGFLNINETVKKYNGTISIQLHENVFEISVILPMEADKHSNK